MLQVKVNDDRLFFGEHFSIGFQRTLRIPDDDKTYPLPPGLGAFPICKIDDYHDRVPKSWVEHGGVFIPMYQREALWISLHSHDRKPRALKVAVGKVNVVSGKPWNQGLHPDTEDYLVSPPQPWLDGINAGQGMIRQFVAMPLGMAYTVEAQLTGEEKFGGIQMIVYESKPGRIPDPPQPSREGWHLFYRAAPAGSEMGLAAGGKMKQKIYPDPHGVDVWNQENHGRVYVHIVNSMMYREITGKEPPATPISAEMYTHFRLPWFDLYDESLGDVSAPQTLQDVKTVKELDQEKGFTPQQDDESVDIAKNKIIKYDLDSNEAKDGAW